MYLSTIQGLKTHTLSNGLTVIFYPVHTIPLVSMQLWYNVGSKDEISGQRGLAHFLEHMVFKGTHKLSETDIIQITNKLSGYCNAFTGYDYTGYVFEFPSHQWRIGLELLADMMINCTFKEEMLNSELGAVIQELKLYRDNYEVSLDEAMTAAIFADHPYHYPIIGYKQDLWEINATSMFEFYRMHYIPNNAALIVVGDTSFDVVIQEVERQFGDIQPNNSYKKSLFHFKHDIVSKRVVLYRDVQQPIATVTFVVPGMHAQKDYYLDLIAWLLANGKGSRLYKTLILDAQLATDVEAYIDQVFDYSLFFIRYRADHNDVPIIKKIITAEINNLIESGFSDLELERAIKQAQAEYVSLFEDHEEIAYILGRAFWATGDASKALTYIDVDLVCARQEIELLLKNYFKTILINEGLVVPLDDRDTKRWIMLQESSDKIDEEFMQMHMRAAPLELGNYVQHIEVADPQPFAFAKHSKKNLNNGLVLVYYHNPELPLIDLIVHFKANNYYDSPDQQGLHTMMMRLLLEGTSRFTAQQLADEFERYGMSVNVGPGYLHISMLNTDLNHALVLLEELLCRPAFDAQAIERVREQLIADIEEYWDDPFQSIDQYAKEYLYQHQPWTNSVLGDIKAVRRFTWQDIITCYNNAITPQETIMTVVGQIKDYDVPILIEQQFAQWRGSKVENLNTNTVIAPRQRYLNKKMNRDQLVVAFVAPSITRMNKEYDVLLLFDQILTGGGAGGMSSKLFELREKTGLFYTIQGSLLAYVDQFPGMVLIKTIVSLDKLDEVQERVEQTIFDALNMLTEEELAIARRALYTAFVQYGSDNERLAKMFLFLERFDLPHDYYDTRIDALKDITVAHIKEAVQKIINNDSLTIIRVGRVSDQL